MLSLKFKRTLTPSSPTPPADDPRSAAWAGPSSLPADLATTVPVSTRELRTRAETPSAPPVQTLFSRDSVQPQQTVAVWDPAGSWPGFSIAQLALAAHGRISEISLMQEQGTEPVAMLRSTVLPTPSGQSLGVIEVEASFADNRSLSVALTLLEQVDRAVILAGANADKDLIRRINDFVRADAWRGPSLLLVSPADKPSRADRLRRATWPRGMKMHVLELFSVNDPGWSQQLISLVTGFASGEPTVPGPGPGPVDEPEAADLPVPVPVKAVPPPASPPPAPVAAVAPAPAEVPPAVMERVLGVLSMGVGVTACAVVSVENARLLGMKSWSHDPLALLEAAARTGSALWRAHRALGAGQPLLELSWSGPLHHHLVMPLPRQPGLLLLACVEREHGDLSAARWQLAVARKQWT
ncbi:hypothetical protein [Sphaerotilus sp.]|uniref:hypothetical protein n=1 Tax=Sphaerotilus sp. TaxID=2093942 RepID=UPI002ACE3B23|nr:hypothetical protein [Sphaerotilus sp.]MDZ7854632.1 hypothetical protein [Sphaerotilus sp.]